VNSYTKVLGEIAISKIFSNFQIAVFGMLHVTQVLGFSKGVLFH